jgi:hypothetical protein
MHRRERNNSRASTIYVGNGKSLDEKKTFGLGKSVRKTALIISVEN